MKETMKTINTPGFLAATPPSPGPNWSLPYIHYAVIDPATKQVRWQVTILLDPPPAPFTPMDQSAIRLANYNASSRVEADEIAKYLSNKAVQCDPTVATPGTLFCNWEKKNERWLPVYTG
jgi:hypothetical protein